MQALTGIVTIMAVTAAFMGVMASAMPVGCKDCPHCQRERAAYRKAEGERKHNFEHTQSVRKGAPDIYHCSIPSCKRNPKRVDSD